MNENEVNKKKKKQKYIYTYIIGTLVMLALWGGSIFYVSTGAIATSKHAEHCH